MTGSKPSGKDGTRVPARDRQAKRQQGGPLLDEFVAPSGEQRKCVIALLRGQAERGETGPRHARQPYDPALDRRVRWRRAARFEPSGGKRRRVARDVTRAALRTHGFLKVSAQVYRQRAQRSPASLDRGRVGARQRLGHGRSLPKPGTLRKPPLAMRTDADWNDQRPGCRDMDRLDPSGGLASVIPLDGTGRLCAEAQPDRGLQRLDRKAGGAQQGARPRVCGQPDDSGRWPVTRLGLASDTGSACINAQGWRDCRSEPLPFRRGRSGRQTDQASVAPKHGSVMRRRVGAGRYDTPAPVSWLTQRYAADRR